MDSVTMARQAVPRAWWWSLALIVLPGFLGGCGDDGLGEQLDAGPDGGDDMVVDQGCPDLGDREREQVFQNRINGETTWTCETRYQLLDTLIVDSGDPFAPAVLTITEGTIIETGSSGFPAIVVTRAGRLEIEGTEDEPVIFRPAGDSARRGDWGGIFMLGQAGVNVEGGASQLATIESRFSERGWSDYGGGEAQTDDTWDCGSLRYVRLEFPGLVPSPNPARNITPGLTLAGCGSDTTLEFVQVHRPLNRGIEIRGGAARMRNVIVDGPRRRSDQPGDAGTDGIHWSEGWRGAAQFLVVQMYDGGVALVGENRLDDPSAEPVSDPLIYNASIFGRGFRSSDLISGGLLVQGGGRGVFGNLVMTGTRDFTVDLAGSDTGEAAMAGQVIVRNSYFHDAGPLVSAGEPGTEFFPVPDLTPSDGVSEEDIFTDANLNNDFGTPDPRFEGNPYDVGNPNFNIVATAADGGNLPPTDEELPELQQGFFDPTSDYRGALDPRDQDWTREWTNYAPQ